MPKALAVVLIALASFNAQAQTYPARTIVFLSSVAGGASEAYMRAIIDKAKENTGATLIFEPRPGGGGAPLLQAVKNAAPDGYTFGITFASATTLNPLIDKSLGIDPLKDFVPVAHLVSLGGVIAVREDFPAKDIRDLVAMARAKPGSIRIATFGAFNKLALVRLEESAGVKLLGVPFKTTSESMAAVLGGHIEATFETVASMVAQRGKLKALMYGGSTPSPQLPGVPLSRELYNFEATNWYGVIAPVGTPAAAVNWVSREMVRAVRDPKVKERLEAAGFPVTGTSAEEFARMMRAEVEVHAELVRKYPEIR